MPLILAFLLLVSPTFAKTGKTYDRKEKLKGISLQTGKENNVRHYRAFSKKVLPYPSAAVVASVLNFSDRCNNELRPLRESTPPGYECRFHTDHLIESFVMKDIKSGWLREHGETERFVLGRRAYNRGHSSYYELVQMIEGKSKKGQKLQIISMTMLDDQEVKNYIEPKLKKDSSFEKARGRFIITELGPALTEVKYVYEATTAHWLLNKELSVGQVFHSLSSSINDLVSSVAAGSVPSEPDRTVASEE